MRGSAATARTTTRVRHVKIVHCKTAGGAASPLVACMRLNECWDESTAHTWVPRPPHNRPPPSSNGQSLARDRRPTLSSLSVPEFGSGAASAMGRPLHPEQYSLPPAFPFVLPDAAPPIPEGADGCRRRTAY